MWHVNFKFLTFDFLEVEIICYIGVVYHFLFDKLIYFGWLIALWSAWFFSILNLGLQNRLIYLRSNVCVICHYSCASVCAVSMKSFGVYRFLFKLSNHLNPVFYFFLHFLSIIIFCYFFVLCVLAYHIWNIFLYLGIPCRICYCIFWLQLHRINFFLNQFAIFVFYVLDLLVLVVFILFEVLKFILLLWALVFFLFKFCKFHNRLCQSSVRVIKFS